MSRPTQIHAVVVAMGPVIKELGAEERKRKASSSGLGEMKQPVIPKPLSEERRVRIRDPSEQAVRKDDRQVRKALVGVVIAWLAKSRVGVLRGHADDDRGAERGVVQNIHP